MKLGKYQKHAIDFSNKYPGWHTFAKDRITRKTINSLAKKNLIEINEFQQFRSKMV